MALFLSTSVNLGLQTQMPTNPPIIGTPPHLPQYIKYSEYSTVCMTDYETRAKEYGFATKEAIIEAYHNPNTIILDVRSPTEIKASVDRAIQTTCTPTGCEELEANPSQFVPDKTAMVIIYCASGRRASKAKALLIEKGYTGKILNAGGYDDIKAILSTQ